MQISDFGQSGINGKITTMDFKAALTRFVSYIHSYSTSLTLGASLIVVTIWTIIRHWTNGVNFDVVGQVGLADQWVHGIHSGAQLGPTNYLLKMPIYIVVNALSFLSPHAKLFLLALLFNLATFTLLFILFKKILVLAGISARSWLALGIVWLASISGSVYWLDYANSRNLETVGGIVFLYLFLRLMSAPTLRASLWLSLAGGIIFFADPLQVFVTAAPLCLYVILKWAVRRSPSNAVLLAYALASTGIGYLVSKLVFKLTTLLLPVSYLAVPSPLPALTMHNALASLQSVATSTLKVFDAYFFKPPLGPNAIREFLNAAVLGAILVLCTLLIRNWQRISRAQRVLLFVIAVNYIVFVASGQALQWETSRYLIMVPLFTVLLVALSAESHIAAKKQAVQLTWLAITAISCVLLVGALAISWPKHYKKDTFITSTIKYMQNGNYPYALSSREVGIPASYFGFGKVTVLPTLCQADHTLHISNLFYDKGAFEGLADYHGLVPVILQDNDIKYASYHCNKSDIFAQFGKPVREEVVPGVGIAEIFIANNLRVGQ